MNIDVTIGRLVLEGLELDTRAAAQVGTAVKTELSRRLFLDGPGAALAGGSVSVLRPAPAGIPPGAGPQPVGRHIAGAVMEGLGHGRQAV
ncbi:hypothetical protein B5P43_17915 [Bacillus sp. SRB_336]|nr:hypothetical protein B5P43_17915 [Bacillus sp. SRB_336]